MTNQSFIRTLRALAARSQRTHRSYTDAVIAHLAVRLRSIEAGEGSREEKDAAAARARNQVKQLYAPSDAAFPVETDWQLPLL